MASALYTTDILRLAASIPHLGRLGQPAHSVDRRAPVCGSRIVVDVQLDDAGRICAFGQDVRACALGQASACLLGAHVLGQSGAELAQIAADLAAWLSDQRAEPPNWPGIEILGAARAHPGRHGAICLPFEAAAQAALEAR
jgi:NifU-like protein involved in Fe-S cluster formation